LKESSEVWKVKIGPLTVAQKLFKNPSDETKYKAAKERSLLLKCQHPNVVSMIEMISLPYEMYMEYIPSSLYDLIQLIKNNKRKSLTCFEIVSFNKSVNL
jgi:hypothetical protein